MEEQVLTIAEMQSLQELGIDTTKASMFWVKEKNKDNYYLAVQDGTLTPNTTCIPTFTMQDILQLLPKYMNLNNKTYFLTLMYDVSNGVVISYCTEHINNILHPEYSSNQLTACRRMLTWVKKMNLMKL